MAQIGSFTRNEDGIYNGEIRTLTLRVKATIRPVEREHDKAPDHRVSTGGVDYASRVIMWSWAFGVAVFRS